MEGLFLSSANYIPLSPISFLERGAFVYGDGVSIIYGDTRYSWRETRDRCVKLASMLSTLGIRRGEVVAALAPNIPALYELHFSVPMAGAVLSALNTRLDAPLLSMILEQLEAKIIFVDYQYVEVVLETFKLLSQSKTNLPRLVMILEHDHQSKLAITKELPPCTLDYDGLLAIGKSDFKIMHPNDECDPISVNYTSGSTGRPKGVVYSHRAAYLNSLAVIFRSEIRKMPVFLWTVDMFRCNGWCFTWAVAALGGTNICIREVSSKVIFDSVVLHKVTHVFGAPTILDKLADSQSSDQQEILPKVEIIVSGALPPLRILSKIQKLGFNINHVYGMTEALGPMTVKPFKSEVESSSMHENVKIKYREGIHNLLMEEVDVKNPESMTSVPSDGKTIGEVMVRGNTLMLGYLKNLEKTQKVFEGGWYRTGDLGTRHSDGYIQIKDRALDRIIHGGETISTIEVEAMLLSHPMVEEAAVVGRPDDVFGETPCAFVKLKEGCYLTSEDMIKFCEDKLPHYMTPTSIFFGNLPVNSTGKIQKFILREKAKAMGSLPSLNGY